MPVSCSDPHSPLPHIIVSMCDSEAGQSRSESATQRTTQLVYSMQAGRMVRIVFIAFHYFLLNCQHNHFLFKPYHLPTQLRIWCLSHYSTPPHTSTQAHNVMKFLLLCSCRSYSCENHDSCTACTLVCGVLNSQLDGLITSFFYLLILLIAV